MRTTINIDDKVLEDVKQYAEQRRVGLSRAVSDLVRRGLDAPIKTKRLNGLVVFDLPADSPAITTERVRELDLQIELED